MDALIQALQAIEAKAAAAHSKVHALKDGLPARIQAETAHIQAQQRATCAAASQQLTANQAAETARRITNAEQTETARRAAMDEAFVQQAAALFAQITALPPGPAHAG